MPSREHSARRSRRNRELEWHSPPLLMQCSEPILRSETWPTNQVDPHVRITKAQDRVYRTCGSTWLVGQVSLRRIGSEHCISKGGECHSNSRLRRDLRALCSLDGMPKVRTFNCDSRFAPIFLSYAK